MLKEIRPESLKGEKIDALLESFSHSFDRIFSKIINALIYPRIDELSGEVLDLLAWQFHIEGWDLAQSIEEKRALLKKAIEIHRYKGTPWAVVNALKVCGYNSYIKEWFQYDGQPYRFKVYIQKPVKDEDTYSKLLKYIYDYKNERSWLDSIGTHHSHEGKLYAGSTVWLGSRYIIQPNMPEVNVSPAQAHEGFYYRMGNYMMIGAANG